MDMKFAYAITGAVFYSIFLVAVIASGGEAARAVAISAAFFAGWSQFIAQDHRPSVGFASVAVAYLAMLLGVVAFALMVGGR